MFRGFQARFALGVAGAVLAGLLTSGQASAAPIALGVANLQDLIDLGAGGVVVGDKKFYDFGYTGTINNQVNVNAPTAAQILVSDPPSSDVGVRFSFSWTANAGEVLDTLIRYKVSVIPANMWIDKVGLAFDGAYTGGGIASVSETVQDLAGATIGQLNVIASPAETKLTDSLDLVPDRRDLILRKDIIVAAPPGGGTATITWVDNTFPQVPEPNMIGWLLAGTPLLLVRRRTA